MTLTVRELKRLLAGWPEVDERGDPTEVWIATGHMTPYPCVETSPLNMRSDATGKLAAADLLLSPF